MQINSKNQTSFGESYRLLIPKAVENYTGKDVSKQISKTLLNSHIVMNTPQSRIKLFQVKANSENFEALDIFTLKEARKIDDARSTYKLNPHKVIENIKILSARILDQDTYVIKNDSDLSDFVKSFIYKDLGINS